MDNHDITKTDYARLSGALLAQLSCAHSVLLHLAKESPWAKVEAGQIALLLQEIDEGRFIEK